MTRQSKQWRWYDLEQQTREMRQRNRQTGYEGQKTRRWLSEKDVSRGMPGVPRQTNSASASRVINTPCIRVFQLSHCTLITTWYVRPIHHLSAPRLTVMYRNPLSASFPHQHPRRLPSTTPPIHLVCTIPCNMVRAVLQQRSRQRAD